MGWRGSIRDLKASTKEEKEVLGDADSPAAECHQRRVLWV